MPRYTVYIREGDKDKWLALKDRPEFIHNALNYAVEVKNPAYKVTQKELNKLTTKSIKQEPHVNYLKRSKRS
jgi:hypothetical protein